MKIILFFYSPSTSSIASCRYPAYASRTRSGMEIDYESEFSIKRLNSASSCSRSGRYSWYLLTNS